MTETERHNGDEVPNGETRGDLRAALVEALARLDYVGGATGEEVDVSGAKDEVLQVDRALLDRDLEAAREKYADEHAEGGSA
jgi:hypothetical protein